MEISARNSTNKVVAIVILSLLSMLVVSLFSTVYLSMTNREVIQNRQIIVTPMVYNGPFTVSETSADSNWYQMTALSFLALRLNVSPATVDANHEFLLSFVAPEAHESFKNILAEEARVIKKSDVNSAFYQTAMTVYPLDGRVDIRGNLKTWIGNDKPLSEIKSYRLYLKYLGGMARIVSFFEVKNEK